jgi:hypothetical protein
MDAALIERIETTVERAVSALFAAAVGFAAWAWLDPNLARPASAGMALAAGIAGFMLCSRTLVTVVPRQPEFRIAAFDLVEPVFEEADELVLTDRDRLQSVAGASELLLTDADRLHPVGHAPELVLTHADRLDAAPAEAGLEPLVLDDILTELGPDARVVRLFDRRAMPTPAQLRSRIDSHLDQAAGTDALDASQALSDALAELRRSLR